MSADKPLPRPIVLAEMLDLLHRIRFGHRLNPNTGHFERTDEAPEVHYFFSGADLEVLAGIHRFVAAVDSWPKRNVGALIHSGGRSLS